MQSHVTIDSAETTALFVNDDDPAVPVGWMEITEDDGVILDLKYASGDNFTNRPIYDCGRCYLVTPAARAIKLLQLKLSQSTDFKLYIFDCYRPRPAQQKLWDIIPNPNYVTPPSRGSMHNRGLAIDLGLADQSGIPIDMGSDFDHFGKTSHTDYQGHSASIQAARDSLQTWMKSIGYSGIRTEWWHYSMRSYKRPLSDWQWQCD